MYYHKIHTTASIIICDEGSILIPTSKSNLKSKSKSKSKSNSKTLLVKIAQWQLLIHTKFQHPMLCHGIALHCSVV